MDLNPASPIANLRETNLTTSWHNGEEGEAQEYQLGMLPRQFLESNDRVAGAYESLQAKLETVAESQQESEKRLTDNLQVVLDTLGDLSKAVAVISQKLAEPDQRPATNSRDVAKILQEISDQMKKGFTAISTQVQKTIQQQASSEAVQNRSEMGRLVEQVKKVELTMQTRGLAEAEASKSRSKGRQQLIEQLHQQVREFQTYRLLNLPLTCPRVNSLIPEHPISLTNAYRVVNGVFGRMSDRVAKFGAVETDGNCC